MIPAQFEGSYALLLPRLNKLMSFMVSRISADLSDVKPVSISSRPKDATSAYQKLHVGKYAELSDLTDLAGVSVVLLSRHDVEKALDAIKASGLTVVDEPTRVSEPALFRYREPKLLLAPPAPFLDRNPDLEGIVCEVQFTSTLQNALDQATHDFDYKGRTYSWTNFRLVAQLRGMLELVDQLIDDIDTVAMSSFESGSVPSNFEFAASILEVLTTSFGNIDFPKDARRFADTVARWSIAVGLDAPAIAALLARHVDLCNAASLDPTSAVLGAILRDHSAALLADSDLRFAISEELETLCIEAAEVPESRRVAF